MTPEPPAPHLVARFRRDLQALDPELPLGIAVSGGPDSLALLLLSHAAYPGQVHAATVDHRLRPASRAEAGTVAAICQQLGVPHATLTPASPITGNLQANARAARYALLSAWAHATRLPAVATGHHLDDQAETLLARLLRGSGVAGLAGIRATRPLPRIDAASHRDALLVRPLLGWRRTELAAIVAAAGLVPANDPANSDDRFDRTRIRRALRDAPWLRPEPLAVSAASLADAEDALTWTAARVTAERSSRAGDARLFDPAGLPFELQRRALPIIIADLLAANEDGASPAPGPSGGQYARLVAALREGRATTLAGILCMPGTRWRFEVAPPRRPAKPGDDHP